MEKQSYLSEIEIPDYSDVIDEIYNGYVKFYSESGGSKVGGNFNPDKIQALTSLMQIISGLENQISEKEKHCLQQLNFINSELDRLLSDFKRGEYSFHPETAKSLKEEELSKNDALEEIISKSKNQIEYVYSDIQNGVFHKFRGLEREIRDIITSFQWIEHYVLEFKFSKGFIHVFNEGIRSNSNFFKFTYHINSLRNITGYITLNNYPEQIPGYSELSNAEREKLTQIGRPLNPDVPQNEIESFIKTKLFPNGIKTNNKRFIHQTGKREGTPIWNQLALRYFDENPELEINNVITKRWLIERIKKAYEVIHTSMN